MVLQFVNMHYVVFRVVLVTACCVIVHCVCVCVCVCTCVCMCDYYSARNKEQKLIGRF